MLKIKTNIHVPFLDLNFDKPFTKQFNNFVNVFLDVFAHTW